jgi:hypothetical protein
MAFDFGRETAGIRCVQGRRDIDLCQSRTGGLLVGLRHKETGRHDVSATAELNRVLDAQRLGAGAMTGLIRDLIERPLPHGETP